MMQTVKQDYDSYSMQYLQSQNAKQIMPLWLQQLRQTALLAWQRHGFPSSRLEEWKYTALSFLTENVFVCKVDPIVAENPTILAAISAQLDYSYPVVFINGQFNELLSHLPSIADVTITSLHHVFEQPTTDLTSYLGKLVTPDLHGFAALNLLFAQHGIIMHLLPHAKLDKPLQFMYFSTSTMVPAMHNYRNLIVADQHSQAEIIENFIGLTESKNFTNVVTEIFLADNSQIQHCKIQQQSSQDLHIATTKAQVHADAKYSSNVFNFGARVARNEVRVDLVAPKAQCELNGFCFADKKRQHDQLTEVAHRVAQGSSQQFYRSIVADNAHAIFNGKVHVFPQAQQTIAKQVNNNLLLSSTAEVDTRPQLQIDADDVQCNHGATVGQLDEEAMFYLQSRGIAKSMAQSLLQYAFANDVLQHVTNPALRNYLQTNLLKHFPDYEAIRAVL